MSVFALCTNACFASHNCENMFSIWKLTNIWRGKMRWHSFNPKFAIYYLYTQPYSNTTQNYMQHWKWEKFYVRELSRCEFFLSLLSLLLSDAHKFAWNIQLLQICVYALLSLCTCLWHFHFEPFTDYKINFISIV